MELKNLLKYAPIAAFSALAMVACNQNDAGVSPTTDASQNTLALKVKGTPDCKAAHAALEKITTPAEKAAAVKAFVAACVEEKKDEAPKAGKPEDKDDDLDEKGEVACAWMKSKVEEGRKDIEAAHKEHCGDGAHHGDSGKVDGDKDRDHHEDSAMVKHEDDDDDDDADDNDSAKVEGGMHEGHDGPHADGSVKDGERCNRDSTHVVEGPVPEHMPEFKKPEVKIPAPEHMTEEVSKK